ncbi:MAG: winged helix-turn-helix transcriptional regulator [Candidatus Paceibacterota bacterium]|jgi:dimeric dUTPase (all-alpha-NTP-PPase superfamily)|nr:winged helix-turn-helix transcriptional regulator [bacterium]
MKTTKENIIEYIKNRGSVSAKDLISHIGISKQAIFIHLKKLMEDGLISKVGNPPVVFYILKNSESTLKSIILKEKIEKIINEKCLFITSIGEIKEGTSGFIYWCNRNNLDPVKTANEYVEILKKYDSYRLNSGLINGMKKIKASFEKVFLDKIFYLDFYAIERFGKTKLGQLLLYGKQSQDKKMIKNLSISIREKVINLIKEYNIDAVCFIPPTVKREVQLMKELESNLKLPVKRIKIVKIKSDIAVPQKTLNKIRDRIENAEKTFFLDDKRIYGNVLIIDDAVGSGATLNIVASKIRKANLTKGKIIGLAITGSYKGFDVISEV